MQILHVGSTLELAGGIESFVMNIYKYIDKTNLSFDFMVCENQKRGYYNKFIFENGGKIHAISKDCVSISVFREKYNIYKRYKTGIVHIHTNCGSRIFDGLIAKLAGVKCIIFHCHTCKGNPTLKYKILQPIFRLLGDYYWACSKEAAEFFFGKKVTQSGKFQLIHNAIDVDDFRYDESVRGKIRNELNWNNDFILGFVGRLSPEKNLLFALEILIAMLEQKENVKLAIVGDGEQKEKIKEIIKEKKIENNVCMLGERKNVKEFLFAFDSFILPSLYEGLGIVLIEAQAAGLPCFASDTIPTETRVTPLINYLSINEKPQKWAVEILNIENNRLKSYSDLIKNHGYDNLEEAERVYKLYKKIIFNSRPAMKSQS